MEREREEDVCASMELRMGRHYPTAVRLEDRENLSNLAKEEDELEHLIIFLFVSIKNKQ